MVQNSAVGNGITVHPWDPSRVLKRVDPAEVKYSRGFLRCRPERWFPGFAAQWLPLAHSIGVEARVVDVRPVLAPPKVSDSGFVGSVDEELLGIVFDEQALQTMVEVVSPGALAHAEGLVGEYLARRLLSSLGSSWTGPEASVIRFERDRRIQEVSVAGGIKLVVEVNGNPLTVWFYLGRTLVEKLDGLWRRQLRSATRTNDRVGPFSMEIAHLAVAPSMLADYMRSGAVVDLEIPTSEQVVIRQGGKPVSSAKLISVGGSFGLEVVVGTPPAVSVPEGTAALHVELFSLPEESVPNAEMSQQGVMIDTKIPISNKVNLIVNGERVKQATLCVFEGRFAISVD